MVTTIWSKLKDERREDRDVPLKAKAAIAAFAWCEAASTETVQWHYLYIPQGVFERMAGDTIAELARACAPAPRSPVGERARWIARR